MPFARPPPLRPGDLVRIVAPAGPFDRAVFDEGLAVLRQRYSVEFSDGIFSRTRYLAGDDARRLEELSDAWNSPDIRAVFCARGGYGVMKLLPSLRWPTPSTLLPFTGFSDITALHLALQARGLASLHAPVITQLGKQPEHVVSRFFKLLEQDTPAEPLTGGIAFVGGRVEGPLLGGNLSMLTRLLGTPYLPDVTGALLLLEDVGERPYRLDRMWTHLQLAGVFERISGIVLGDFTGCEEKDADYTSMDILRELATRTGLPCAAGFRVGHGDVNLPVPLGIRARLDADRGTLEFLEPYVQRASGAMS